MDEELAEAASEINHVIVDHNGCQTRDAKWLCLSHLYEKFHRPNLYDVGGTCIVDLADYWFMFKTEQFNDIFLLHILISNRQDSSFTVAMSYNNELSIDKKHNSVYLPISLKEYHFENTRALSPVYITTYSFSNLDVETLKDKLFYIGVSFPLTGGKRIERDLLDNVKMCHDFGALLSDPVASDFTIESVDGEIFKVHKVLLTTHSEVFKAMLKEDTAESQNNHVKLIDVSAEDLCSILEFIYSGTVKDVVNSNFFNILMLADRFNLSGLRELSQYVLSQQLYIENAVEILMIADISNSEILKTKAMKFIKKNPSVLETSMFSEINNAELIRELCAFMVPL